jgi:Trehalase
MISLARLCSLQRMRNTRAPQRPPSQLCPFSRAVACTQTRKHLCTIYSGLHTSTDCECAGLSRYLKALMQFRDMPSTVPLQEAYQHVLECAGTKETDLGSVLHAYFRPPGTDMEENEPADWQNSCVTAANCKTPAGRQLAKKLCTIWPHLCKKVGSLGTGDGCWRVGSVHCRCQLKGFIQVRCDEKATSTLISIPHPMIVAGSRFRELYYWDSFWTMKGLLACGMLHSAVQMVENFMYLIETFGHVPNGTRVCFCACNLASPHSSRNCKWIQWHPCASPTTVQQQCNASPCNLHMHSLNHRQPLLADILLASQPAASGRHTACIAAVCCRRTT